MPRPLPVVVCLIVTSAEAGTASVRAVIAANIARFMILLPPLTLSSIPSRADLLLRGRGPRRGILRPLIRPVEHLGHRVQDRFAGDVAVRLVRQRHVANDTAMALDGHVEALGLNRERAGVVV